MATSLEIIRKVVDLLADGRSLALCTVVASRGSVPARPGAKMIVLPSGQTHGTVGGAGLEEKTRLLALTCLAERRSQSRHFDLAYYKKGGLDSLCGGSVDILVEYMAAPPHVLICGGGHVGLAVARLCEQLDYGFSVLDERQAFASPERFPQARAVHAARPEAFFPGADLSKYSHVVLVGHSHQIDTDVLEHCVRGFEGYIGLICSRLKRKQMFARLRERGIDEAELARVEAPVGLPIGAETPAEIAVSILASIIADHKAKMAQAQPVAGQPASQHDEQPDHGRDQEVKDDGHEEDGSVPGEAAGG